MQDKTVYAMALLRLLSGSIEICAAVLIFRLNRIDSALRINGVLAIIGPTLLLLCIIIGAAGLTQRLPFHRLLLLYLGAFLIFWGTRQAS